jgi:hypothetical protein
MYGPGTEQGIWRIRTNKELQELYIIPYLAADIIRRSSEWLGHVIGIDQTMVNTRKKEKGKRTAYKHRLRWPEDAKNDLQGLIVKRLRQPANDGEEWASVNCL